MQFDLLIWSISTFYFIWSFLDGKEFDRIQEMAWLPIDQQDASDYRLIDKFPFFLVWLVDVVFALPPILFYTIQLAVVVAHK